MSLPYPQIDPVLVHIGPVAIRWYGLAYIAGIMVGWRYVASLLGNARLWTRRPAPITVSQFDDLILWITLGIILGGRLGHVVFYTPELLWTNPLEILQVWNGGMSFHGGTLGVLMATLAFAWRHKLDVFSLGDVITAAVPPGLFFVRLANFVNGELWGRPTDVPWAMVFPGAGPLPRHPSQLYEAALEGLVLFTVLAWATFGRRLLERRGVIAGIFFLGYGLIRIGLENLREPDSYLPIFPFGLTMGMMLSLPMVVGGLWLIWRGLDEQLPPVIGSQDEPA